MRKRTNTGKRVDQGLGYGLGFVAGTQWNMLDRQSLIIGINQTLNVIITGGPCEVDSKTCIYGDFIGEATFFVKPLLHIRRQDRNGSFLPQRMVLQGSMGSCRHESEMCIVCARCSMDPMNP